jgi:hypothetical protein
MIGTWRNLALSALALTALACGRRGVETDVDPDAPTTVLVDNQSFPDMNIYVIEGSRRVRLGTAGGHSQTRFVIPKYLVRTLASLRFQADPIGGRASPYSQEITVSPGDQLTLRIPPS